MENYTLNTKSKDIVGGVNEVDNIYEPVVENGDLVLWGTQEEGVVNGTLRQIQYDAIKTRIENSLPIIIKVNYAAGYTATFTSIASSPSSTPGKYSFMYIDYNTDTYQYFFKCFKMESDLTCQIHTKII